MLYPIASLEDDKLSAIHDLEKEIGGPVVALTALETDTAHLAKEKLAKLQQLEKELGVVLVAMRPN